MSVSIEPFEILMPMAVQHFWAAREKAAASQRARGRSDRGNRGGVTAGKNLNGFEKMVKQLIVANGIPDCDILTRGRNNPTIPGFYRPTKEWDLLVVHNNQLVAAIELKSQVGPSFGNNFNNRVEEALGNAVDLNTAFRDGAFGKSMKPFVGYLFVLEDCAQSRKAVQLCSPHFSHMPEFEGASYADRYGILCRKLVREQLYDAAALVLTKKGESAEWSDLSECTGAKRFAVALAGRVSALSLQEK